MCIYIVEVIVNSAEDDKANYNLEAKSRNPRAAVLQKGRSSRFSAMTSRVMNAMSTLYKAGLFNSIMFFLS